MLKIYEYEDIKNDVDFSTYSLGSSAKVFSLSDDLVFKQYLDKISIMDPVFSDSPFLDHILGLSMIKNKSFASILGVVVNGDLLCGLILEKAPGKLLCEQCVSLESLLTFDNQLRTDILDISKHFAMHDINDGSIFYDNSKGITLVDLDCYSEETDFDNSYNNLIMYYQRLISILNYYPFIKDEIYERLKKGVDYCRLEVIFDVVNKYTKKYGVEERILRLFREKK